MQVRTGTKTCASNLSDLGGTGVYKVAYSAGNGAHMTIKGFVA